MDALLIPWSTIILIAIAIVGIVQWLKGAVKKAPSWIWAAASVLLCGGLSAAAAFVGPWVLYAAVALSFAQLCYEIIVQGIPAIVKKLIGGGTEPAKPADTQAGVPGS